MDWKEFDLLQEKRHPVIAYDALFLSHFQFRIVSLGAAAQVHLEPILILQKKAIRANNNLKYNEHSKLYFKLIKTLTLIAIYDYET